ncbi:anthranilate synthase component I [Actinomadura sp. 3N407]|uniref:anthranilate synthase component I n=1 Tax=Actinomadura sp. 3N407 TaxID=3457423 RepID=UPI003FCCEB9E
METVSQQPLTSEFVTAGGVRVTRTATPVDPERKSDVLNALVAAVGERRGGVLSSGMEYPGRYSRWHMAYVDPCLEIVARGRTAAVRALNERGRVVLPSVASVLRGTGEIRADEPGLFEVFVPPADAFFTEEERSRQPTVFTALRAVVGLFRCDDPHLGLYGAFGYDLSLQFEPLRTRAERPADQRDLVLHLADEMVVVDRKRETSHRMSYEFEIGGVSTEGLPRATEPTPGPPPAADLPAQPVPGVYAQMVRDAKEKFVRGDLFEVTPGHAMYARCDAPAAFFERLRETNPAPYEFLFNLGDGEHLVGASPEMFVRVTGDRVETCPIAGTIKRGDDALEDAEQIRTILSSSKDESELTMCTDVDRNDKSRICVPGSVRVLGRRQIEIYSRLIHTVDHIEGRLRPGFDALDAFLTHMWAVTVTGAPKTWAMQFIEDHEESPRRWYGGAVGCVGFDGSMNTGLTLRTAQIRDGVATVRAGATLLYDSDPEEEERETHLKASALLGALTAPPEGGRSAAAEETPPPRPGDGLKVLLVDHEDSFVNTLADYFRQQGAGVVTLRHGFPMRMLDEHAPDLVVLSPGPGRPEDFATRVLLDALDERSLPVFGVCLGLQAMVEHAGGDLTLLPEPSHGKPGQVKVTGGGLFEGLPDEFTAARYHSLHATPDRVKGFQVTALTGDVVMAIEDPERRRWAVQFHPESILTAAGGAGHRIVANILGLSRPRS